MPEKEAAQIQLNTGSTIAKLSLTGDPVMSVRPETCQLV
jgi:hypothetical protein